MPNFSHTILTFNQLHFSRLHSLSDQPRPILSDISWSVAPSQLAAILGANGSGKSTLLRLAVGYLWPQHGSVQLLGHTLGSIPLAPLRARVGIVEANTVYPFDDDMTTHDVVTSGYFSSLTLGYSHPTPHQRDHARHLLDQVGLAQQAHQLYHTLSTGQRMRTLLSRALVRQPELLLLDEPTAGLDLPAREILLATLARLHTRSKNPPAIIMVTHHLEELLPDTTNLLLLSTTGHTIAQGPPATVLTNQNLSTAYNLPIELRTENGRHRPHINPATWDDLLQ